MFTSLLMFVSTIIRYIKYLIYHKNGKVDGTICCSICLEEMSDTDKIYVIGQTSIEIPFTSFVAINSCRHMFHYNCIKELINHSNKKFIKCPLCRKEGTFIFPY